MRLKQKTNKKLPFSIRRHAMFFFFFFRRFYSNLRFWQIFTITRNRVLDRFQYNKWYSCVAACVVLLFGVGCGSMATSKMPSSDSKDRQAVIEESPAPSIEAFTDIDGKEGSLKILFLGDGRGNFPGVRREFQAVVDTLSPLARQNYLHANFLLGPNLTKHNLESRIQKTQYSILYYAGHAGKKGRILPFADSNLNISEFLRIINQNPPKLLIMNACYTLGDPYKLDLATTMLLESGAIFTLGTNYFVEDDMPVRVFPQFFKSLVNGKTVGDALNDACRKAPHGLEQFFLLGDPSLHLK
jgi:hypothetical protein